MADPPYLIQEYAVEYTDPDGKRQMHVTGIGPVGRDLARTAVTQGIPFWGTSHALLTRDITTWREP